MKTHHRNIEIMCLSPKPIFYIIANIDFTVNGVKFLLVSITLQRQAFALCFMHLIWILPCKSLCWFFSLNSIFENIWYNKIVLGRGRLAQRENNRFVNWNFNNSRSIQLVCQEFFMRNNLQNAWHWFFEIVSASVPSITAKPKRSFPMSYRGNKLVFWHHWMSDVRCFYDTTLIK